MKTQNSNTKSLIPSKHKLEPDTNKTYTPQPSTPIKHAGSEYPGGDDDWDWEMSLRYKYPTINTDTYTLNEDWKRGREYWEDRTEGERMGSGLWIR